MTYELINRCERERMPRQFISVWLKLLSKKWPSLRGKNLVIVFVDEKEIRRLNKRYRDKNKVTDILSFEGLGDDSLGELVICPQVLRRQSVSTGLSFRLELGFMIIHGCLHLLGYDHETSKKDEKIMFALQDRLFASLSETFGKSRNLM